MFITLSVSACSNLTGLLFYPDTHYYQQPEDLGVQASRIMIETEDGEQLANWYLNNVENAKASILFLHGNGENISTHINSVAWLTEHGYKVFLLDYRGYGHSTGTSTLASALSDIEDAHQWLSTHESLPLIVFGQSLGGALAITYTANARPELSPIRTLVTESAPASWPQIAREAMRSNPLTWLLQIPAFLLPGQHDAEKHIRQINDIPVLLMHSPQDEVVPYHHSQQLLDQGTSQVRFIQTQGGHIAGFAKEDIRNKFLNFISGRYSPRKLTAVK